jgi:hypothetical protein
LAANRSLRSNVRRHLLLSCCPLSLPRRFHSAAG